MKPEKPSWLKKRYEPKWALLGLAILILSWVFLFTQKPASFTQPPQHRAPISTGTLGPNSTIPPKNRNQAERKQLDAQSADPATSTAGDQEDECWKRIDLQIGDQKFIESKKAGLQNKIAASLLEKGGSWEAPMTTEQTGSLFLRALGQAGLLSGRDFPRNEARAIEMLNAIHNRDPENSAPLLYLAMIYERDGNRTEAQRLFDQIKKAKTFNSYLTSVSRTVYAQVETPADLLGAIGIVAALPIPDMIETRKFMIKNQLAAVAEQMVKANDPAEPAGEFINAVVIEWVVGQGVLQKLNKPNHYEDRKAYMKKIFSSSVYGDLDLSSLLLRTCDVRSAEPAVERLKRYLASHPAP